MATVTDKVAAEHQPVGGCPHAVASAIIQRHRDTRQRFDSADYEMARRVSGACGGCTCSKGALGHSLDLEHEPEPETAAPHDELRCLRLQRFDSADWVLHAQRAKQSLQTNSVSPDSANVAQLLMDRHALKCCACVGPRPVKNGQYGIDETKSLD